MIGHAYRKARATPAARALIVLCLFFVLPLSAVRVEARDIVLVVSNRPAAVIVVANRPLAIPLKRGENRLTVRHAAEELQLFIKRATGAELPIVAARDAPEEGALILVGRSALTERYRIKTPSQPEGLRAVGFERGLAIVGEVAPKGTNNIDVEVDRGTLFGVYEYLERALGFRFYLHVKDDPFFGIVVPERSEVLVDEDYGLTLSPDFPHRVAGFAVWEDRVGWARVTRGGSALGFHANHTDGAWGKTYRAAHPEYFVLNAEGERDERVVCYSEPGVLDQRLRNIEAFFDGGPWAGGWHRPRELYIPFVPADVWGRNCHCEPCQRSLTEERGRWGRSSDIVFGHGAELARRVQKRWPRRRVAMLAYETYMQPPDIGLPNNLDVMVCPMISVTLGKEDFVHRYNMNLLKDWSHKLQGRRDRLFVWNYYCWPAQWSEAPTFFPHYLQKWLRDTYRLQAGEFINPGSNPPQFEMFMCSLWHRLLWNRDLDVDDYLRDHCEQFFGPAAGPAEEVYRLLIDRWENVKWDVELEFSDPAPELTYGQTYTAEVITDLRAMLRDLVAAVPEKSDDIYHRRATWFRAGFQGFIREAETAHRWLAEPPAYAIGRVDELPAGRAGWTNVPALMLTTNMFGYPAAPATSVRMLRQGDRVHAWFECDEPAGLRAGDELVMRLFCPWSMRDSLGANDGDPFARKESDFRVGERFFRVGPPTMIARGNLDTGIVANRLEDGVWTVHLAFSCALLGLGDGQGGEVVAQIERHRAQRRKAGKADEKPGIEVSRWAPPMQPRWVLPPRYGKLGF